MSVLTRHDGWTCTNDSIAWALETHVKQPDTGVYQFAILHGNEDAPSKIEFFTQQHPTVNDLPAFVWEDPDVAKARQ